MYNDKFLIGDDKDDFITVINETISLKAYRLSKYDSAEKRY